MIRFTILLILMTFPLSSYADPLMNSVFTKEKFENVNGYNEQLYKDGTLNILMIWTTWCPNCISEIKTLNDIKEKYSNINISSIEIDSDKETVLSTINSKNISFDVFLDKSKKIVDKYKLRHAVPQIIIIDKNGVVIKHFLGPVKINNDRFLQSLF